MQQTTQSRDLQLEFSFQNRGGVEICREPIRKESVPNTLLGDESLRRILQNRKGRERFTGKTLMKLRKFWKTVTFINRNTPLTKVWNTVRKIKGRPPRAIHILRNNGVTYSATEVICGKLASIFADTSSNNKYSEEFKRLKHTAEQTSINFASQNDEIYNSEFSYLELQNILDKLKDTSPGPDGLKNSLLKNLPDLAAITENHK